MRTFLALVVVSCFSNVVWAQNDAEPKLPKVVLLGDSIRLSYTAGVRDRLAERATVVSPKANGQDSANLLRHLDRWAVAEQPQVAHFNCGIHDTKKSKGEGTFQVSPEQYEANLRSMVERLRAKTNACVLFSTTTPILNDRAAAARSERSYSLLNESVEQYNEIAKRVMRELNVPVNDLHAELANAKPGLENLIVADGVHLTPDGQKLAADSVAGFIARHLKTQQP